MMWQVRAAIQNLERKTSARMPPLLRATTCTVWHAETSLGPRYWLSGQRALYPQIWPSSCATPGKLVPSSGIGREIPSLFILASSVVRFSPSFPAAPRGPPTIQPACSSVSKIKARSESSKAIDEWKVRVRCRLGIMSSVWFL